jgi:hypothetical protein
VQRRLNGPETKDVTGGWTELHSEELSDLYSYPNTRIAKSRKMRHAHKMLFGNTEGNGIFESPMYRWEHNIKNEFTEIGCNDVDGLIWLGTEIGGER